jgi:competence protein ComEA
MERITRMCLLLIALLVSGPGLANNIDINTADAQTLATGLTGVGDTKARAIVAYRDQNGPFKSPDDLKQVKGIGDHILELNRGNISAGGGATP